MQIDSEHRDRFDDRLEELGATVSYDTTTSPWFNVLLAFGPILLIILIIWFMIARSMRSAGAGPGGMLGSFGKSRHRISSKENSTVTFNDVAGVDAVGRLADDGEGVQDIVGDQLAHLLARAGNVQAALVNRLRPRGDVHRIWVVDECLGDCRDQVLQWHEEP